jgi:hypothetical protein
MLATLSANSIADRARHGTGPVFLANVTRADFRAATCADENRGHVAPECNRILALSQPAAGRRFARGPLQLPKESGHGL